MSKHRTPEQWQTLAEQQRDCGLSALQFCKQQGIDYASFCKWRKRLSGTSQRQVSKAPSASEPDFLDLSSLMGVSNASGPSWHIVLSLGNGVELRLSQGG